MTEEQSAGVEEEVVDDLFDISLDEGELVRSGELGRKTGRNKEEEGDKDVVRSKTFEEMREAMKGVLGKEGGIAVVEEKYDKKEFQLMVHGASPIEGLIDRVANFVSRLKDSSLYLQLSFLFVIFLSL